MENMELERVDNEQGEGTLQRLDRHIERLERLIRKLLDGVDVTELPLEKRLLIGARFASLHQRSMGLRHVIESDRTISGENVEMTRLMRILRGEPDIEVKEAIHVLPTTKKVELITPYHETPSLEDEEDSEEEDEYEEDSEGDSEGEDY